LCKTQTLNLFEKEQAREKSPLQAAKESGYAQISITHILRNFLIFQDCRGWLWM